jgi:predicted RNA binding protein YcfA (HicA-like mRNA interferase family)
MPTLGPIKRKDLIYYFRKIGFIGPFSGSNHQFMIKDNLTVYLPNPHQSDIGKEFLIRILKQAKIDKTEWEQL